MAAGWGSPTLLPNTGLHALVPLMPGCLKMTVWAPLVLFLGDEIVWKATLNSLVDGILLLILTGCFDFSTRKLSLGVVSVCWCLAAKYRLLCVLVECADSPSSPYFLM
jgi:hypothetical protein